MIIAFDCDMTLIKKDNSPNYEVIDILRWFLRNGDRIIIWSGGGVEYAHTVATRLGLMDNKNVFIAPKTKESAEEIKPDICFDDELGIDLAKVNIHIFDQWKDH